MSYIYHKIRTVGNVNKLPWSYNILLKIKNIIQRMWVGRIMRRISYVTAYRFSLKANARILAMSVGIERPTS